MRGKSHPIIARKASYISKEKSNYYCHSEYKLFLDFLYEGEQNGKKGRGDDDGRVRIRAV